MADDDTPDEGGLEPAETEEASTDAALDTLDEAEAPAAEPETYTREQLADLLPHFDQFATHEGAKAFEEYGKSYAEGRSFISSGGHKQDAEPEEAEAEAEAPGLWGTPWQVPTTWEEVQAYANTDDPNARKLAWMAVANEPSAPEDVKQAYFAHWAAIDQAGAAAYTQQATMTAAEARLAELEARMEAKYAATHEDLLKRNMDSLTTQAVAAIPGFADHGPAISALLAEQAEGNPAFTDAFLNGTLDYQMKVLRRLTVIAAAEAEPVRKAKQQAAVEETDAAKIRSRTETSRTNGAPEDQQSAAKRKSLEDARRVGGRVY